MARATDPKKLRHSHPNGRMPPSPYLANRRRYAKVKQPKKFNGINLKVIGFLILIAPLVLGVLVALANTF